MGGFFDHCMEQKALDSNPVASMGKTIQILEKAGQRAKVPYRAFSETELKRIFAMPAYGWNAERADYVWAPIIAALSGIRLGEIIGLSIDDIGFDQRSQRHVFVVRKGKNNNSKRVVPKDAHDRKEEGLSGAIHSFTQIETNGKWWYLTADFGTAPASALVEFVELLASQGMNVIVLKAG